MNCCLKLLRCSPSFVSCFSFPSCISSGFSKIRSVWDSFSASTTECLGRNYLWAKSFFITRYPLVNKNKSIESLQSIYWGLGKDKKWMECVDGCNHYLGPDVFDKGLHKGTVEPGFMASMKKAFSFAALHLNRKIDAAWYLALHRHTCSHFNDDKKISIVGQAGVGAFRGLKNPIRCDLTGVYFPSAAAVEEFNALDQELSKTLGSSYGLGSMVETPSGKTVLLSYKSMTQDQVAEIFNLFLTRFYQQIDKAANPDEKLTAIAGLHQRLEWLHPVADGTSRTSLVVMNLLLTNYGFHPAFLEYPHVSSTYSLAAWKAYLQEGMVKWEAHADKAVLKSLG